MKNPGERPTVLRAKLAEIARRNYERHQADIERIRHNIQLNRNGQIPLTAVALDASRIGDRVARESGMSMVDAVERVNGVANFQDVSIVRRMLRLSRSVCRVMIGNQKGNSGFGTGFLVAPRIMITNNHVLPDAATAARSFAQFNYELNEDGNALETVTFRLAPKELFFTSSLEPRQGDPLSGLDFTIVAVEEISEGGGPKLEKFDFVRLDGGLGKILDGETCAVIQHPQGDYKKIVLKDIRMITATENVVIYESDTQPGSSGSPVFGMGTAEVVALHHSGIPRTDADGNWLRKDGSIALAGDPDDIIDWVGNEGIRISRIVDAVRRAELPNGMDTLRDTVLAQKAIKGLSEPAEVHARTAPVPVIPADPPAQSTIRPEKSEQTMAKDLLRFELVLSPDQELRDQWRERAGELVTGFVSTTQLFPDSTDPFSRRIHYLVLRRDGHPWKIAEEIENLPHVEYCTPDLPSRTDVDAAVLTGAPYPAQESTVPDVIYDDGTAKPNEIEFLRKWKDADVIKQANGNTAEIRRWNHKVVNWKGLKGHKGTLENIRRIRFTQLDTGYTGHSKTRGRFDLEKDLNFVEGGSDAFDPKNGLGFKHPGHGTRTASIAIGQLSASILDDGNYGLLSDGGKPFDIKLVPFRVAERVVLIGSGKDMVDAARTAIQSGTDVMFMCMGSHPRPMINAVAREAYEHGVIWVCAAGNQVESVVAPALYPGTITVAAINPALQPWQGSSNGPEVDISAPGEDVFVPFWNEERREIMAYGDGTSYATPHVASAAVLWKAKHYDVLRSKYSKPWQVVEAFRSCLRSSRSETLDTNKPERYGGGILNIDELLKTPLPEADTLVNAYAKAPAADPGDLGIREAIHYLWNTFKRKLSKDPTERTTETGLTERGMNALEAFGGAVSRRAFESTAPPKPINRAKALRSLFSSAR